MIEPEERYQFDNVKSVYEAGRHGAHICKGMRIFYLGIVDRASCIT